MGLTCNPDIRERLQTVSQLIPQHREIGRFLELERDVLGVQLEIESGQRETFLDRLTQTSLEELAQESSRTKTPMSILIDAEVFDSSSLRSPFTKVLNILVEKDIGGDDSRKLLRAMQTGQISLTRLIEATLREGEARLEEYAAVLGVQPALLSYALGAIVRPFFEELARKIDPSFYDGWWNARCPICGRTPSVAKIRQRKRYLVCTFCGAEYLSDHFVCVHCGNTDPSTLKYLSDENDQRSRIDFCTRCTGYLKVLDEYSGDAVPKGFEDILTLSLDLVAVSKGLKRS